MLTGTREANPKVILQRTLSRIPRFQRLANVGSLIRVGNLLAILTLSGVSCVAAGGICYAFPFLPTYCFATVLIAAAGYTYNDVCDLAIDRLGHPTRPLATGRLSRSAAKTLALSSASIGFALLMTLGLLIAIAGVVVLFTLRFYSSLKAKSGITANVAVAVMTGSLVVVPLLGGTHRIPLPSIALSVTAFGLTLAREVIKDFEDKYADEGRRRTLATTGRHRVAQSVVIACCIGVAAFSMTLPHGFESAPIHNVRTVLTTMGVGVGIVWSSGLLAACWGSRFLKWIMYLYLATALIGVLV